MMVQKTVGQTQRKPARGEFLPPIDAAKLRGAFIEPVAIRTPGKR